MLLLFLCCFYLHWHVFVLVISSGVFVLLWVAVVFFPFVHLLFGLKRPCKAFYFLYIDFFSVASFTCCCEYKQNRRREEMRWESSSIISMLTFVNLYKYIQTFLQTIAYFEEWWCTRISMFVCVCMCMCRTNNGGQIDDVPSCTSSHMFWFLILFSSTFFCFNIMLRFWFVLNDKIYMCMFVLMKSIYCI